MATVERPPEISQGARKLLHIARENDTHRAIAKNAALFVTLEFGEELMRVCRARSLPALVLLLGTATTPQSFLVITAAALSCISDRMVEHSGSQAPKALAVNDFNRHVLQGFAEALADLAWPDRSARDFDGPSPEVFLSRVAEHDLNTLWLSTLQNYLANIFQDYFAALRIRDSVPSLDPDTEVNLRSSDARLLAEYAILLATNMQGGKADPAIVAFSLDQAIDEALEV